MEKETNNVEEISRPLPKSQKQFPVSNSLESKVFRSLEEAYAEFDRDEETKSVQYIVPNVELPPVPSPQDIEKELMQNALLLIDSGEYALSRNILSEVLKKNGKSPDAIRWMGWCFKQEVNLANAEKCYEELVQIRSTGTDYFELGEIYYAQQKDADAIEAWNTSLGLCDAESPYLFDLHKGLGNAFTRTGDYDSAEENYNKALILRGTSDVLQVNMGTLSFQRQNFLQAMAYFKCALDINAFNDRAWTGVAMVAREMKDNEWARATLLKALDINAHNEVAMNLLTTWSEQDGASEK